ncbi:MADS-box transcription factor 31 [Acorus calamus]|uniref:MADS-box transcription factor 31 n=1 Tax=Acorus calamus TaxID=4465 RepID=A0AAV9DLN7_ACOCL|nr:MADS-box transcription factor 31 [Acorus calamus]
MTRKLEKIENVTKRQVTFSKRRNGLMKKALEISILCGAEIAVISFSPSGRLSQFSSNNKRIEKIFERFASLPSYMRECTNLSDVDDPESARDELNKLKEEMREALTLLRMYEPVVEEIKSREDAESTAEFIRGLLHKVRERKKVLDESNPIQTATEASNKLEVAEILYGTGGFTLPHWFDPWLHSNKSVSLRHVSRFQECLPNQLSQNNKFDINRGIPLHGMIQRNSGPCPPNTPNVPYFFHGSSSRNPVVNDMAVDPTFQSMERGLMKLSIYEQGEFSASGSRMNQANAIHQFPEQDNVQPQMTFVKCGNTDMYVQLYSWINSQDASGPYYHDVSQVEASIRAPSVQVEDTQPTVPGGGNEGDL